MKKIKDDIKKNMSLFVKEKYMNTFFDILRKVKEIIKNEEKKKIETIFHRFYKEKKKEIPFENKIQNYFIELKKSIFKNSTCLNYTLSKLEISYLKRKAKIIRQKCYIIAIQNKKKIEYIIELYIALCQKELEILKEIENEKIQMEKYGKYYKRKTTLIDQLEEDDDENKEKVINLFIDNFNGYDNLANVEIIHIKKGEYINAYLFQKKEENYDNYKLKIFKKPTSKYLEKKNREKKKSKEKNIQSKIYNPISKFLQYKKDLSKVSIIENDNHIQNNNKTLFSESSIHFENKSSDKNLFRLNRTYNHNKIQIKINYPNRFKSIIKNNSKLSIRKNNNNSSNHKSIETFPKVINSYCSYNNLKTLHRRNNSNSKSYFSKTDLYY